MEVQPAIHEASSSIIILAELYTAAQQISLGSKAVKPYIGTVHNGINQTLVGWVINLTPEGGK